MKHLLTGKKKKVKPTLPEDFLDHFKKKNVHLETLIKTFNLEINY